MLLPNKVCFKLDLRTGSEYIGWAGLIGTVIGIIINIYALTRPVHNISNIMFDLAILATQCGFSVLLLVAVKKTDPNLLLKWLFGTVFNLLLVNLFYILFAVGAPNYALIFIIGLCFLDSIVVYLWVCVLSYYQNVLGEPKSNEDTVIIENAGTTAV